MFTTTLWVETMIRSISQKRKQRHRETNRPNVSKPSVAGPRMYQTPALPAYHGCSCLTAVPQAAPWAWTASPLTSFSPTRWAATQDLPCKIELQSHLFCKVFPSSLGRNFLCTPPAHPDMVLIPPCCWLLCLCLLFSSKEETTFFLFFASCK